MVLSVGSEYGAAGVQPLGDTLLATRDWTYLIGSLFMLGVFALILNTSPRRSTPLDPQPSGFEPFYVTPAQGLGQRAASVNLGTDSARQRC